MTAMWLRLTECIHELVRRTQVWQPLDVRSSSIGNSVGLLLSLPSGDSLHDTVNTEGRLARLHVRDNAAEAAAVAAYYEWEGDDADDDGGGDEGGRTSKHRVELSAAALLWQRRWSWHLASPSAAEALLPLLVDARRAEGWWSESPAGSRSALLCRSVVLQQSGGLINTAMLQYGAVVMDASLVVTFWQEPQHGRVSHLNGQASSRGGTQGGNSGGTAAAAAAAAAAGKGGGIGDGGGGGGAAAPAGGGRANGRI